MMQAAARVALVTGGAQGIGKSLCEGLLKTGTRVCITDVNRDTGGALSEDFKKSYGTDNVMFHPVDVRDITQFEDAIIQVKKTFGRLDVIGNNAGIADEEKLQLLLDVNLKGVIHGNILGLKHLAADRGVVVNVSSVQGLSAVAISPFYTATKFGVVGLTRAMALAHAESGVRFNCVCPCFTRTEMFETADDMMDDFAKNLIDKFGVVEPSLVFEAFEDLIEDKNKNGHVSIVSKHKGIAPANVPTMEEVCGVAPSQ